MKVSLITAAALIALRQPDAQKSGFFYCGRAGDLEYSGLSELRDTQARVG